MNRPARFTLADLRRAMKAAEMQGTGWAVEVMPDGTIRVVRVPARNDADAVPLAEKRVLVF